jgi:hypothetical protein
MILAMAKSVPSISANYKIVYKINIFLSNSLVAIYNSLCYDISITITQGVIMNALKLDYNVIGTFTGLCRGLAYQYKLIIIDSEIILESYRLGKYVDYMTLEYTEENMDLMLSACEEIQKR